MYVFKAGHMAIRKAQQGKKIQVKISKSAITLMWKNVNVIHEKMVATKNVLRQKPTQLQLKVIFTNHKLLFRKVNISKKSQRNVIKLKLKTAN